MEDRRNQVQFYWQSSAAGLLLGMGLGLVTGALVAAYLGLDPSSGDIPGVLVALPLLGVLVGAICGFAAGIVGSLYTSRVGRLPPFLITGTVAVGMAATLGAVFSGWVYVTGLAILPAVALGLLLPWSAERFRRSTTRAS